MRCTSAPAGLGVDRLGLWIDRELPAGQAKVARALLVDGPEFEYPERPVTYAVIAAAFAISKSSVATHIRRIRCRHPELHAAIFAERSARLGRWRDQDTDYRRRRSQRWGKQRWAAQYKQANGRWPWDDY